MKDYALNEPWVVIPAFNEGSVITDVVLPAQAWSAE